LSYLPVYNSDVRELYEEKGFVLLNEVSGSIDVGGKRRLQINPPKDATLHWAIEAMRSRIDGERLRVEKEIARTKAVIRRTRKEDILNQSEERLAALEERLAGLDQSVPTFKMLKTFFLRIHEAHLTESVDGNLRDVVNRIIANQQWAEQARTDLSDISDDGDSTATENPKAVRSHKKGASTATLDPDEERPD
jgi:hypothetical protein